MKNITAFLKENLAALTLLVAIVSLGLSGYTLSVLKSGVVAAGGQGNYPAPAKILKELPKNAPTLGSKDAKLTIVEFADFQCPYCERFFSQTYPDVKKEYVDTGKVKFVYMDFPFLGPESTLAANAAQCAADQGKYWEYHDKLFNSQGGENQGAFVTAKLKSFGAALGLDTAAFNACVDGNTHQSLVQAEHDLGTKYGVSGTPAFFIGTQTIKGAYPIASFRQVVDAELAK